MLPSIDELLATQRWVARRFARRADCDATRLAEALDEAALLSGSRVEDEPAALLFALLRCARAIPDTWDILPRIVAVNHAKRAGVVLTFPQKARDRENLFLSIAGKLITFEQLCQSLRPQRMR